MAEFGFGERGRSVRVYENQQFVFVLRHYSVQCTRKLGLVSDLVFSYLC